MIIKIFEEEFFYKYVLEMEKAKVKAIISNKHECYSKGQKTKKNGSREIYCIKGLTDLYTVQKKISNNFLNNIPMANDVYGFVKGFSYKDFMLKHLYKKEEQKTKYYLRLDIKDFFDSIKSDIICTTLKYYIKTDCDEEDNGDTVLDVITGLTTMDGHLPQGAVTSPTLSNIIFRQLDIRIQKYCRELKVKYSRYADDLLFSSYSPYLFKNQFMKKINYIIHDKNFKLNFSKIIKSKDEISLNGFVIGNNIRLSRKRKSDISKILFLYKGQPVKNFINDLNQEDYIYRNKRPDFNSDSNNGKYFLNQDDLINYLAGYRSFLINWIPIKQGKTKVKHINLINRIEELLDSITDMNNEYE